MDGGVGIGIDPAIHLSFALPVVSHRDDTLVVDWPQRRSVVVIETRSSIRRQERGRRATSDRSGAGRRTRRSAESARSAVTSTLDAALIRLIDSKRVDELLDRGERGRNGPSAAIGSLLSFDGGPLAEPARLLDVLDATDWSDVASFARRHLELRSLLAPDGGVLARTGLSETMIRILRSEVHEDLGDPDTAISEVTAGRLDAVSAIRACALMNTRHHFEEVMAITEGIGNLDDSTAYLCVMRGSAASALGDPARATAAFAEAVRLARTNERIVVRTLLERARHHLRRGHPGRAVADLKRARVIAPEIDGLDSAIRSFVRRRNRR